MPRHKGVVMSFAGLTAATVAAAHCGLFACNVVRLMLQPGVKYYEVLVRTNEHVLLGFFRDCDVPTVSQRYGKIWYDEDVLDLRYVENKFPDETSFSEYDEVEQSILSFNDLFPFNIVYPDDLKLDKDNDDNEIDMIQSSGGNENTHGSNKLLEASHDKINKVFKIKSFVLELNVCVMAWNYLVNGMLYNLIKNLYVPFGIPFKPKRYNKDGDCARMLRGPRISFPPVMRMEDLRIRKWVKIDIALPPRDQRYQYLRYEGLQYTEGIITDFEMRLASIYRRESLEKLKSIKINDVFLTCNTSPKIFNKEFSRMSRIEDVLFTYEVEIDEVTNIPCDLKKEDDSEQQMSHEPDNDME
ncbi:hypothetical protein Tco_0307962 [Tanacetum coccineum]